MRLLGAFLAFVALPLSAAAYTAEQQRDVDRFDELLIENIVACFGFQMAAVQEQRALGLDTFRSPEYHIADATDYAERFMVAPPAEADLLARLDAFAEQARPLAVQFASLVAQDVPLDDPSYGEAKAMADPCSELPQLLRARNFWAEENGLPPFPPRPD